MTQTTGRMTSDARRAWVLAAVILVQAITGLFFLADVTADFHADGKLDGAHMWLEFVAALALVAGVVFLMLELRRLMSRVSQLESGLRAARGEMAEVIDAFFCDWKLTPSERDVALLVLKGLDNDSIAKLRGTAPGTVRAQCASVYAKAGVDGRSQLFSVFLEELLSGEGVGEA